ncbi:YfcE family phosphodiesterase, partial [Candidatus Micrarchaeota archaeon]|nr:YfcE family phosphodiesterase [Candidatus Micrarchaeota archaeon]
HDHIEHVAKAVALFENKGVDLIVHAGDVCSPFVWPFFRNLNVPIKCVYGNNKGDVARHQEIVKKYGLDVAFDLAFLELEHSGKKIAVHHGDPYKVVENLAKTQNYDAIVYGHNHVPRIHSEGRTLLINPGSLITKVDSELNVLRDKPGPSVALYEPETNKAELVEL